MLHFYPSAIFDELWLLASGQLVGISVILADFPSERTADVSSRSFDKSNSLTYTVASSFVCTSPLAGLLETLTVSNSAEFRSLLLNMCMLAPESSTNSLSSGFVADGAERLRSLVSEKKVALSFAFSFKILLANPHASPRAHRSCLSISS